MKIKRYVAASMRAALAQVRAEQGADAVILSSRRTQDGIEVIAAVDYDETLLAAVTRQRAPLNESVEPPPPAPPGAQPSRPAPAVAQAFRPASTAPPGLRPASSASPALRPASSAPQALRPASSAPPALRPASSTPPVLGPASSAPQALRPAPTAPPALRAAATRTSDGPSARAPTPAPLPTPVLARSDPDFGDVRRELKDLRQLLETGLAGMAWSDERLREPMKARVLEALLAMDIDPDIATALAARIPPGSKTQNPAHVPLALILKHLPVVADLASVTGGVMAIVGPTGAGKTTTIAKLAARWCIRHGTENLALVSTDAYRIGARDQLMSYSRILGVPMHAADGAKDLARIMNRLKSKKLVLIDTAGMGGRDVRLTEQLDALRSGAPAARVLLALPAQGEGHALGEIVRSFAPAAPVACVLTKVDEAASLGAVLSSALRHRLKIAYLCNGQRVPEDLHPAHQSRVWLVRTAAALRQGGDPVRDAAYFVRHFGGGNAHA
jgi:flagellar biosynthesis protein FlhF